MAEVEHQGERIRICSGHNARWRRAKTDAEREDVLSRPLRSGPAMVKTPAFRVPPELDARFRVAAKGAGLDLNDAGRAALAEWTERQERRRK